MMRRVLLAAIVSLLLSACERTNIVQTIEELPSRPDVIASDVRGLSDGDAKDVSIWLVDGGFIRLASLNRADADDLTTANVSIRQIGTFSLDCERDGGPTGLPYAQGLIALADGPEATSVSLTDFIEDYGRYAAPIIEAGDGDRAFAMPVDTGEAGMTAPDNRCEVELIPVPPIRNAPPLFDR